MSLGLYSYFDRILQAVQHPKLNILRETIEKEYMADENTSIIVFTQFRDMATRIIKNLKEIEMAKAR